MRKQQINIVEITRDIIRYDCQQAYQLRIDRRWPWLQKACFFVLRKLRAFYIDQRVVVHRCVMIDPDKFIEKLFKKIQAVELFNTLEVSHILIGTADLAQIMKEDYGLNSVYNFYSEYMLNGTIMGLRVTVIPWMSGVLVMPKGVEL